MTPHHTWKSAARRLGIPYDEYEREMLAGNRTCSGVEGRRHWVRAEEKSTNGKCLPCERETQRLARKKATERRQMLRRCVY